MGDAQPKLFVISGPSGAGKGTLVAKLLERVPSISRTVTVTTRSPRVGECDGVDYHFMSQQEFEKKRDREEFVEWALVHGNYYGTPRQGIVDALSEGKDVVLVIDVQGASRVKESMPEAYLIFIEPPSIAELVERLTKRQTETEEEMKRRLSNAELEMALAKKYDYVIINDQVDRASDELIDVVEKVKRGMLEPKPCI